MSLHACPQRRPRRTPSAPVRIAPSHFSLTLRFSFPPADPPTLPKSNSECIDLHLASPYHSLTLLASLLPSRPSISPASSLFLFPRTRSSVSTISKTEVHAGAGDAGEGYKPPQGGPRYEEGKEHSHKNLDSTDERSIANKVRSPLLAARFLRRR